MGIQQKMEAVVATEAHRVVLEGKVKAFVEQFQGHGMSCNTYDFFANEKKPCTITVDKALTTLTLDETGIGKKHIDLKNVGSVSFGPSALQSVVIDWKEADSQPLTLAFNNETEVEEMVEKLELLQKLSELQCKVKAFVGQFRGSGVTGNTYDLSANKKTTCKITVDDDLNTLILDETGVGNKQIDLKSIGSVCFGPSVLQSVVIDWKEIAPDNQPLTLAFKDEAEVDEMVEKLELLHQLSEAMAKVKDFVERFQGSGVAGNTYDLSSSKKTPCKITLDKDFATLTLDETGIGKKQIDLKSVGSICFGPSVLRSVVVDQKPDNQPLTLGFKDEAEVEDMVEKLDLLQQLSEAVAKQRAAQKAVLQDKVNAFVKDFQGSGVSCNTYDCSTSKMTPCTITLDHALTTLTLEEIGTGKKHVDLTRVDSVCLGPSVLQSVVFDWKDQPLTLAFNDEAEVGDMVEKLELLQQWSELRYKVNAFVEQFQGSGVTGNTYDLSANKKTPCKITVDEDLATLTVHETGIGNKVIDLKSVGSVCFGPSVLSSVVIDWKEISADNQPLTLSLNDEAEVAEMIVKLELLQKLSELQDKVQPFVKQLQGSGITSNTYDFSENRKIPCTITLNEAMSTLTLDEIGVGKKHIDLKSIGSVCFGPSALKSVVIDWCKTAVDNQPLTLAFKDEAEAEDMFGKLELLQQLSKLS